VFNFIFDSYVGHWDTCGFLAYQNLIKGSLVWAIIDAGARGFIVGRRHVGRLRSGLKNAVWRDANMSP